MPQPAFLSLSLSILLIGCATAKNQAPVDTMTTVYVVRHAEKLNTESDTPLSPLGELRAKALADTLADAGVELIYATTRLRTQQTVAPLADRFSLEPVVMDPNAVDSLVQLIKTADGIRVIVVAGHNNTVPRIVQGLSGEAVEGIPEAVFDRLYRVRLSKDGPVAVDVLRYGATTP